MTITISPELEGQLEALARERSLSVAELVDAVLMNYVRSTEDSDADWVRATRSRLPAVWPTESFEDWRPPNGS